MRVPGWLLAAASACVCSACGGDDVSNRQLEPNEVLAVRVVDTDLALPPSAENVWQHKMIFQDAVQLLRFDAKIDEAREFARRAIGRDAIAGEDPNLPTTSSYHWWLRRFPPNGEGGSAENSSRSVKVVLEPRRVRARVWLLVVAD